MSRDFQRFQAEQEAEQKDLPPKEQRNKQQNKDQETLNKTKAPLNDKKSLDEKNQQRGEADGFYDANGNYISADDFVSSRDYDGVEEGDVNDASAELTEEEAFELAARNAEERRRERDGAGTATDVGRRNVRDDTTGTGASDGSALGVRGDDTDLFGNPAFDESDSLIDENDTGVGSEFDLAKREQQKINEEKAKQKVAQEKRNRLLKEKALLNEQAKQDSSFRVHLPHRPKDFRDW